MAWYSGKVKSPGKRACLLALAAVLAAGCSGGPIAIHGTFRVHDARNRGTGCEFTGTGYADIFAGTQVVVTAPDGTVIGSGALGKPRARADATTCAYRFTITGVDPSEARYGIEVARRGVVWFSPQAAPHAALVLPAGS